MKREFCLSDVLTVFTGCLLSSRNLDGLYDILSFLIGKPVFTHQIPGTLNYCETFLFKQFLDKFGSCAAAEFDDSIAKIERIAKAERNHKKRQKILKDWLHERMAKYGKTFEVTQLSKEDLTSLDSYLISSLKRKIGDPKRIILITH